MGRADCKGAQGGDAAASLRGSHGEKNAVVISQKTLAKMLGVTDRTVRSAIADLVAQRWISVVKLNGPGTVSAYVVNDRVAWGERRDNLPLSVFSATVVADQEDQEGALLGHGELRRIPSLYPGRCSFQAVLARSRRVSRTLTVWNRTCPALTRKRARSTATKVSWRHAANSAWRCSHGRRNALPLPPLWVAGHHPRRRGLPAAGTP